MNEDEAKLVLTAANRILRDEVLARARSLAQAKDSALFLRDTGVIEWQATAIGTLIAGDTPLTPRIELAEIAFLEGEAREQVRRRLTTFIRDRISRVLSPLMAEHPKLSPVARGLLYRIAEGLGSVDRGDTSAAETRLSGPDRQALQRVGLRLGEVTIYLAPLLKPAAVALRALLWATYHGLDRPAPLPPPGRVALASDWSDEFCLAIGYRRVANRAVRADRLEKLADTLRERAAGGPVVLDGGLAVLIATPLADLAGVVTALGYRDKPVDGVSRFVPGRRRRVTRVANRQSRLTSSDDHPFAALRKLEIVP